MPNKVGRPKSGNVTRDAEAKLFLTREDADWLQTLALDLGFTSRGQLLTAIVERLCLGGMAPAVFLKVGWQLQKRANLTGASCGAGFYNPFEKLPPLEPVAAPRPPLPMPDEELAPAETRQLLASVRKQLQEI